MNIPGASAYCASKHALEAIADGYRVELASWKIRVAVLEPGAIKTEFTNTYKATAANNMGVGAEDEKKGAEASSGANVAPEVAQKYREAHLKRAPPQYMTTEVTTEALREILFSPTPLHRYRAGRDSVIGGWVMRALPTEAVDRMLGKNYF